MYYCIPAKMDFALTHALVYTVHQSSVTFIVGKGQAPELRKYKAAATEERGGAVSPAVVNTAKVGGRALTCVM